MACSKEETKLCRRFVSINCDRVALESDFWCIYTDVNVFTPAYATGTTYAKFDHFRPHSFVSPFEQAIALVCGTDSVPITEPELKPPIIYKLAFVEEIRVPEKYLVCKE